MRRGFGVHEVLAEVAGLAIAVAVGGHQSWEKLKPCDLHKPKTHQIKSARFFGDKTRGTPPEAGFPRVLSFRLGFRGFHGVTPGLFWAVTRLTQPGKPR
ncbi:hypothetical protein FYZ45_11680 [Mobiluncus mulieris]|nr:hypothetical protein [Mobiluncus mulieris]